VIADFPPSGYKPIAETDFHHVFAETIRSGYPSLGTLPVVTTGMSVAREDDEFRVPWFDDPRFSHCIIKADGIEARQDGTNTALPVSEQLSNATTTEEALEIIKASFSSKLQVMLQMSDGEIDHYTPVIDLGIDSLVAVEVRSWFVKELKVDMPVLKVLGGGSIADLSQQALQKLPEKLLSNIGKESVKHTVKQQPTTPEPRIAESGTDSTHTSQGSSSPNTEMVTDNLSQLSSKNSSIGPADSAKVTFFKREKISFAQSRFWFLRLLLQDQTTFNITFYYKVIGNLRVDDLERAIRITGLRHEALRTCFVADEKEADLAYQVIADSSLLRLEQKKISCVEDVAVEYAALQAHNFDIEKGETMRVVLLSLSSSSHWILFNYHHIAMDGVAFQVFLSDLEKAYKGQSLGPPPTQFADFSRSQREAFANGEMNDALSFWKGIFADGPPPILPLLPMAQVSSRTPMYTFDVHQVYQRLEPGLAARVKQMSKTARATPFHFYMATFKTMLFRLIDLLPESDSSQDLTIGIADANRNDGDVLGTLGLFLNLLTLRFRRKAGQTFAAAITETRNTTYAALANSNLPFDVLLAELNVPRSSSYSPFFQAFFDYRQGAQEKQVFGNCEFEIEEAHPGRTAYDLTLDVTESTVGTTVVLRTQKTLYDQAATDLLLRTYIDMLEALSYNVSFPLEDIPLFSQKRLTHALGLGRGEFHSIQHFARTPLLIVTTGPNLISDWPETLPHRIDQVAEENQDKTAIMDGLGRVLTYADMIQRIEAIGEGLQNAGVGLGSRVLVFQQATSDWVCSMLAIMRVGGVYVSRVLRASFAIRLFRQSTSMHSRSTQDVHHCYRC
jgi:hybrid polyketide synthase/nonribosomal peptide synthetase ACE1